MSNATFENPTFRTHKRHSQLAIRIASPEEKKTSPVRNIVLTIKKKL